MKLLTKPSRMGPKSKILEIRNRADFGFKEENYISYRLEIGPFQEVFKNRARATYSGKWAPIFKRDRALLKTAFVLHGQAFVYAQRICGYWFSLQ